MCIARNYWLRELEINRQKCCSCQKVNKFSIISDWMVYQPKKYRKSIISVAPIGKCSSLLCYDLIISHLIVDIRIGIYYSSISILAKVLRHNLFSILILFQSQLFRLGTWWLQCSIVTVDAMSRIFSMRMVNE